MAVAAPDRPKVTAAFLEHVGGYMTDNKRLFRVLAVGSDSPEGVVLVEDCELSPPECAISLERNLVRQMHVVRWPPLE